MNYDSLNVAELRKEAGRRGVGSGVWRAGAGREALLSALRGENAPAPVAAPAGGPLEQAIAAAIAPFMKSQITPEEFSALFDTCVEQSEKLAAQSKELAALRADIESGKLGAGASLRVSFASPLKGAQVDGVMHRQVPQLIAWIAAGVPVWAWGMPGWGKSHIAHQIGAALGLRKVVVAPIDPFMTPSKIVGNMSLADGRFVEGWAYDVFKHGGLLCMDEMDSGDISMLVSLNSLFANESYLFPNGETVKRHPDFRVMACANTKGDGNVAGFTARVQLDAASLDRFAVIELKPDEGLEMAVACGGKSESVPWTCPGPLDEETAGKRTRGWVQWVQKVRKHVGNSVLIGPRASYLGCAAIRAGVPVSEVADAVVFKLTSRDTRENIVRHCGDPVLAC